MDTIVLNSEDKTEVLNFSKSLLSLGEIIAFPTETVYGLGGNIFDNSAIEKIFEAKNRQLTNPLAAHIGNLNQIDGLWKEIPNDFYKLAEKFLPGPISIIYRKSKEISDKVTAGFDTLSIRFPDNKICIDLINNFGFPLAATSANLSGKPSPINAGNVLEDLNGAIPLIVDDGNVTFGFESTVLSLAEEKPTIFRQGIISQEEIEEVLNEKVVLKDNSQKRQYAPSARISVFYDVHDLYNFIDKNILTNFVILSESDLQKYNFVNLKQESLFGEFRKADINRIKDILIVIKKENRNSLLSEKINLAINGQR